MKTLNVWETNFANNFIFLNTIEELIEYLNGHSVSEFLIKDNYEYGNKTETQLERNALNSKINLNYTDDNHKIAICQNSFLSPPIISKDFFEKNKDIIIPLLQKDILNKKTDYYLIPPFLFDDKFLDVVLEKCTYLTLKDVELTDEQIEKIKSKFIDCDLIINGSRVRISDSRLISYYTKKDLEGNNRTFYINEFLSDRELENLKYLEENANISISFFNDNIYKPITNTNTQKKELIKLLNHLEGLGKNVNVTVELGRRMDIYDLLPTLNNFKTIKSNIYVDLTEYTFEEFMKESNKLDNLVSDIKNSNLSPLEKYMAVYDIVKLYKPYKENKDDLDSSRKVKYILDNDYMVCVGYAKLLNALLERVGIESCGYSTKVYEVKENESVDLHGGHARQIVHITDPKYGIDGYYMADPTWDSNFEQDTWDYALLPLDNMQRTKEMYSLETKDFYLDVHSFEEFNTKMNIYLTIKINEELQRNKNRTLKDDNNQMILNAYDCIFRNILETLISLDKTQYLKYEEYISTPSKQRNEEFYERFLTDFGHYVVNKTNKPILKEDLALAAAIAKHRDKPEEIREKYAKETLKQMQERDLELFPYELGEGEELIDKPKTI